MTAPLVKICGITRREDALAAVGAGARAIGFVFWPDSPRAVDPYRARAIVSSLPPFIATVGVFVNQPVEHVNAVAALVRLSAVQLHGDESPAFAARMLRPVVKAIPMTGGASGSTAQWNRRVVLLLDAHDPARRGGTGHTIDWAAAAAIASERQVLLAGGLTPENIADAVRLVRPFGVDVSSGVEDAPGIKNHARLAALFKAIHAIDLSDVPARP
jgi:phosphoribosylanthranilate isomerase